MKLQCTGMLVVLLASWTGLAQASLQVLPHGEPVCVFGGRSAAISVTISNASSTDFGAELRTQLYQANSATAVLVSDVSWNEIRVLSGQTVLETARLDFPAVKAETKFLVQWLENSNHLIGITEIWVYPTNQLAQLKTLLNSETLGVLDPNNELRPVLKQSHVAWVDLEQMSLEEFSGRLAILGPFHSKVQMPQGIVKRVKAAATNGVSVLWLQTPASPHKKIQPSFFSIAAGTNNIIVAQAGLVADLASNPQSQQRFVQLCRKALQPEPWALPGTEDEP